MRKSIRNILGYNIKSLVGFELIYKLVSVFIFTPIFLTLFDLITKVSGYKYLTFENVIAFLSKPITIIFLFLLIILITFYTLIDLSTVIIILDSSYQKKKVKIKDAFIKYITSFFSYIFNTIFKYRIINGFYINYIYS